MKSVFRLLTGMLLLYWVASANAQLVPPGQLDFGSHRLYTTSPPRATTLTNSGNQPLSVIAVSPATGVYAQVGGSCGAAPFSIPAQGSCTITHTFRPTALVDFYQTNTVTLASGALVNFGLAGRGAQGRLTVPFFTIWWLSTPIGTIGDEKLVVLGNSGPVPVEVLGIRTESVPAVSAFVRTGGSCPAPPFEIDPNTNCSIAYTFVPSQLGESRTEVFFRTDAASEDSVNLRGEGGPELPIFANGFDASAPALIQ